MKTTLRICFLVVIETIFCFTPLGTIPIGPIAATLSMVPVIIGSLIFGKKIGAILGFVFGLYSFIYWTFIMPTFPTAFIFTPFAEAAMYKGNLLSLVICFVPRILAGYVPSYVSDILKASNCEQVKSDMVASLFGSLTNTIFVLLLILLFFGKEYSTVLERSLLTILGTTIITNGIPEAIVCAIICPIVVKILRYI